MRARNYRIRIWLGLILLAGSAFRFHGFDWDKGYHLQPDERYVSLVLSELARPDSLGEYLDPGESPLSPFNTAYNSYIYGQLPLTVISYLSGWLGMDSYGQAYLVGRALSAFWDALAIGLIFLLGKRLWNERVGLIAAVFYALMPLSIQYAHFMVMESWLVFFWLVTILLVIGKKEDSISWKRGLLAGIFLGMALAIKVSSVMLVPLAGGIVLLGKLGKLGKLGRLGRLGVIGIVAVVTFRFFQPTIFASANWFDWSLRGDFSKALDFQRRAMAGEVMFPPQWQWVGKIKWWFPFKNLMLWGVGPAVGGLGVAGIIREIIKMKERGKFGYVRKIRLIIVLWLAGIFIWQGGQFVKTMRYYVPFLPFFTLLAASLFKKRSDPGRMNLKRIILRRIILFLSLAAAGAGAVMFTSVYRTEQTRIQASKWIYENIPTGATIAIEEWDDPLPLGMPNYQLSNYQTFQMAVYAPDDEVKDNLVKQWLEKADWIVLSSYRAKGTIGRLENDFPIMSRFYRELESGTLGFVRAKKTSSFPGVRIGGREWSIDDSSAEEVFWVYDHPVVEIYRKSKVKSRNLKVNN